MGTLVICILAMWLTFRSLGRHCNVQGHVYPHCQCSKFHLHSSSVSNLKSPSQVLLPSCGGDPHRCTDKSLDEERKQVSNVMRGIEVLSYVWLQFVTEILMHFNSVFNGFLFYVYLLNQKCPLPGNNFTLPSVLPTKWKNSIDL